MNLGQIMGRIETGIQDAAFTREDHLLPLVNEFMAEVGRVFRLPELQASATIDVAAGLTSNQVDMPADYYKGLYRVYNETGGHEVNIRSHVKALERIYNGWRPDGLIEDVAVHDRALWFHPKSADRDQELTLFYYREPVPIENADDPTAGLDGLPPDLTHVAADYALWRLFILVEDGIEGRPVNTEKYAALYQRGLGKIQAYGKDTPDPTPVIPRTARFF